MNNKFLNNDFLGFRRFRTEKRGVLIDDQFTLEENCYRLDWYDSRLKKTENRGDWYDFYSDNPDEDLQEILWGDVNLDD